MPDAPVNSPQSPASAAWLDWILVLCGLVLAGLLGAAIIRNSDIWLHLATGRTIAQGNYKFGVDPFSFTTTGRTWINHSWLFDLSVFTIYRAADGLGLAILHMALAVAVFLVLITIRKTGSGLALPAIGAALALLAANTRLSRLEPATFSYLFLALIIALLVHCPRRLPLWIGLLCAVWVNFDGWFILGPLTVALWVIGQLVQPHENGPRPKFLFATLAAAVIGGLVNPHHVFAYMLPDELAPALFSESVRTNSYFRSALYFHGGLGRHDLMPAPAIAYYVLLVVGFLSFLVNVRALVWSRAIIWLALGAFSLLRWRCIPFFVIATTPFIVLNFQEVFGRLNKIEAARMLGLAMRGLAALGLAFLAFAAWPGWLGPDPTRPERAARVQLTLAVDPAHEAIAKQVQQWITEGKLPANERVFCSSLDTSHYLAWFAPDARSFLDSRWNLFEPVAGDYLELRRSILVLGDVIQPGQKPPDPNAPNPFFKKYAITSAFLVPGARDDNIGSARVLWANPDRWAFRALAGRDTLFGWLDPPTTDPHPELRIDAIQLAFGSQEPAAWSSPLKEEPRIPTFWDSYLAGPPTPPIDMSEGQAWLAFSRVAEGEALGQNLRAMSAWGAMVAGQSIPSGNSALNSLSALQLPRVGLTSAQLLNRRDVNLDRWAGGILAVRALRKAQMKAPDDPLIRFWLAEAYRAWPAPSSLTLMQWGAALQQTKARLDVASGWGDDTSRLRFVCADQLTEYYRSNPQYFELAVESARESLNLLQQFPRVAFETFGDSAEEEFKRRKDQLDQLDEQLRNLRNHFELAAENDTPAMRFRRAKDNGLPGEALSIVENAVKGGQPAPEVDPVELLDLLIHVGRAEDARAILQSDRFAPATVPPNMRETVRRFQFLTAACCGDFPEALRSAEELAAESQAHNDRINRQINGEAIAMAFALDPVAAPALVRAATALVWVNPLQGQRLTAVDSWTPRYYLGFIALEAGDTRRALQALQEGLQARPADARPSPEDQSALFDYNVLRTVLRR
ncbi:MAG: hypothetical protein ACJ8C4_18075 [Gemmataceae bacterium]